MDLFVNKRVVLFLLLFLSFYASSQGAREESAENATVMSSNRRTKASFDNAYLVRFVLSKREEGPTPFVFPPSFRIGGRFSVLKKLREEKELRASSWPRLGRENLASYYGGGTVSMQPPSPPLSGQRASTQPPLAGSPEAGAPPGGRLAAVRRRSGGLEPPPTAGKRFTESSALGFARAQFSGNNGA
ncbi:hypothetical protein KSP40_PGU010078 [Platanthera guangdongensis]|uniref:Uncharacterized protein n=1 Tax=Platanthera guangdongensis TaxID=2320717 RepID=A0ABR2MB47_9ASPA